MNPTNPELRPDPRTTTADQLLSWIEASVMCGGGPVACRSAGRIAALMRLVRDLVAARDAAQRSIPARTAAIMAARGDRADDC